MKKYFIPVAVFSLFVLALSASAQEKLANFSGTWNLNVSKSKLDERARIESQTITVTQTDKDIKIETATKRLPPPADAPQGGGGRMGGGFGGGDVPATYTLDGKETSIDEDSPMGGKVSVKYKAKFAGGKLLLSQSRTFSGPMGEVTFTMNGLWSLAADAKTLTIERETTSPRGTTSTTMVYTKKS